MVFSFDMDPLQTPPPRILTFVKIFLVFFFEGFPKCLTINLSIHRVNVVKALTSATSALQPLTILHLTEERRESLLEIRKSN